MMFSRSVEALTRFQNLSPRIMPGHRKVSVHVILWIVSRSWKGSCLLQGCPGACPGRVVC